MKKLIYSLAILGLIFTSCSKDEETTPASSTSSSTTVLTSDIDETLLTQTVKEATTASEITIAIQLATVPVAANNTEDVTTIVKNSDGSSVKTIIVQRQGVKIEKWEVTFNNDGSVITVIENLQSNDTPTYTLEGKLRIDGSVKLSKNATFTGFPNDEAVTFSSYVLNPDNSYHYFGTYKSGITLYTVSKKDGTSKGVIKDAKGKLISTLELDTDGSTIIKEIYENKIYTTTINIDRTYVTKDDTGKVITQGKL